MINKLVSNVEGREKSFLKRYKVVLVEDGYEKWIKEINAIPEWETTTLLEELLKNIGKIKEIEPTELEIILDLLSVEWLKISWLQALKSLTQKGKNWKPNGSEAEKFIELTQILQQKIGEEESNKDTSLENSQKSVDELIEEIRGIVKEDDSIKKEFNAIRNNFSEWEEINSLSFLAIKEKMIKSLDEFISKLEKSKYGELIKKLQELQKRFKVSEFDKKIEELIGDEFPFSNKSVNGKLSDYYNTLQIAVQERDEIAIIEAKKNLEDLIKSISDDDFSEALNIHSLCKPAKKVKQELSTALDSVYEPNSRTKSLYSIAELITNSDCLADPAWKIFAILIWHNFNKSRKTEIQENYKAFQKALQKWDKEVIKKIIEKLTELINTAKNVLAKNAESKLEENMLFSIPSEMSWIVTIVEPKEMVELRKIKNLQQQFDWEKALFLNPNLDEATLRKIIENVETSKNPLMKALFENIFLDGKNNLEELMNSPTKQRVSIQGLIMDILVPEYFWG